jgi:hypothetical protein
LWHILDAAGETDIGEKPTLEGAKGILLTGDDLHNTVAGCVIKTEWFLAKFHPDNRFEVWTGRKQIDTGEWWADKDKCWLQSKAMTGGWKVGINLVLDEDTIKWYDSDGTLDGKGIYANIHRKNTD